MGDVIYERPLWELYVIWTKYVPGVYFVIISPYCSNSTWVLCIWGRGSYITFLLFFFHKSSTINIWLLGPIFIVCWLGLYNCMLIHFFLYWAYAIMLYIYKCGVIYIYYYSRVWSINSSLTLTHTLKEYDEKVEYTPHCNDVLNK